ncbi:peptidoglycan-binding protein [filamentous cyanobacterium CCP2]|nr:peptidoglycan-binding protein [filamentous cyanobacterium CCP2]
MWVTIAPASFMMVYCSRLFLVTCLLSGSLVHQANLSTVYAAVSSVQFVQSPTQSPSIPSPTDPTSSPEASPASESSFSPWLWWLTIALIPLALVGGVFYGAQRGYHRQHISKQREGRSVPASESSEMPPSREDAKNQQRDDRHWVEQGQVSSNLKRSASLPEDLTVSETARLSRVDIVEALLHELHSPDATKRRKAIWELGQRGDSRAVQSLVDLMVDSDSQQRSLILAAISEISIRTLKPINRALLLSIQDDSSDVRKNGIRDVSRLFELVTQMSQLLQYATSDADTEVRETAEWALSQLNRIRPLPGTEGLPNSPHRNGPSQLEATSEPQLPLSEETD